MRSIAKDSGVERTVRGTVNATGTVFAGTGFTSTKIATGQYTVRFLKPFKTLPSVTVSPHQGSIIAAVLGVANDSVTVATATTTPTSNDGSFDFVAVGGD